MNMLRSDFGPTGPLPPLDSAGEEQSNWILQTYDLDSLDSDPELTAIAQFAARLCETPMALVSLLVGGTQRFIARQGTEQTENPSSVSFCSHAMLRAQIMQVPDALLDPRFAENPLVLGGPSLRFYAGQPLVSKEGKPLGALCVVDTRPRPDGLTPLQRDGLEVLGRAVMRRLGARREALASARALDQRDLHLRALADSIPAIAWSADREGNFDYVNRQLIEFVGDDSYIDGGAIHPDDFAKANGLWQECLRTGETYEIEHRVRRHDGAYRWMMARSVPIKDAAGQPERWFGTAVDIHDVHEVSEARDLLAKELSHRIKNIFAVVSGLVSLSARRRPELKGFGEELVATIQALGRAHDYVRPAEGVRRSSLHGMLADLFSPYGAGETARVLVRGDNTKIAPRAATPLALVFHELATNSAKYGALSADEGTVQLTISDEGEKLLLHWVELGGPPPAPTQISGFGSQLVESSVTGHLGGTWQRRFEADGLVCDLTISKRAIVA